MKEVKIFVIEDNVGDILLIQESCERINPSSTFIIAMDGEEAMQKIDQISQSPESEYPDFIILDLNLPKRNGREVLERLKKDAKLSVIPVIVFSSSSGKNDIQSAYRHHANTYMVKPFDLEEFESTIRAIYQYWVDSARSAYK